VVIITQNSVEARIGDQQCNKIALADSITSIFDRAVFL
jgi:hypothetical protein